ncbi:purple acid phosphatase-like, partial [Trifolium medium]|nr:purple acid phosphatase-like [Trifolium medium]
PQQVHITQGDLVGKSVIVSWVTEDEPGSNTVRYWSAENSSKQKKLAKGKIVTYRFFNYSSGDLGQSYDSNKTLSHYELNPRKGQAVLFVGDLSYADNFPNHDNVRWDTWG